PPRDSQLHVLVPARIEERVRGLAEGLRRVPDFERGGEGVRADRQDGSLERAGLAGQERVEAVRVTTRNRPVRLAAVAQEFDFLYEPQGRLGEVRRGRGDGHDDVAAKLEQDLPVEES